MSRRVVIVGGGQAAGQLAMSLRNGGHDGELVLVTAERHAPYQRPPLSKLYLAGRIPAERVRFPPPPVFDALGVDLRLGTRVMGLDTDTRTLGLDNGETLGYDKLALVTGASPIPLRVPGYEFGGIRYLRTIEDADRIRTAAGSTKSAIIVGAGYIGLEVAATLRQADLEVRVIEREAQIMPRVAGNPIAEFYRTVHRDRGVNIALETEVVEFVGDRRDVRGVKVTDGRRFDADLVVVGVGVRPNMDVAEAAGLPCADGIEVDERACTIDPDVVAAGDCTWHPNGLLGRHVRLESVHNALEQSKTAAATLLGRIRPYRQMPWFWSDQYQFKWQAVGLGSEADDYLVDGDVDGGDFVVYGFRDDRLISIDTVNRMAEHMAARKLLNVRTDITRAELEGSGLDLSRLADAL